MYYYIFEQPKSKQERTAFEKIREVAREYGIYGEMSSASPARSAGELVEIALKKESSTIVAIGDDWHINSIVSAIINFKPKYKLALGVVSTDPNSILFDRWGFNTAEEACETLKYRKLTRFSVGLIDPDIYFLSSIKIEPSKSSRIILEVDRWKAEAIIDRAEISNNLYVLLEKYVSTSSVLRSAYNWLIGKDHGKIDRSIFKGRSIRLTSPNPLNIFIGNRKVAQTPANIYKKLNALKIITKRAKIK